MLDYATTSMVQMSKRAGGQETFWAVAAAAATVERVRPRQHTTAHTRTHARTHTENENFAAFFMAKKVNGKS